VLSSQKRHLGRLTQTKRAYAGGVQKGKQKQKKQKHQKLKQGKEGQTINLVSIAVSY
jgi:hypothetical protein